MPTDATYSIADLARLTGLNVRTIRYYIAQGLIPSSGESGPGAHYGDGHLGRLRLTKRLQAEHLPLSEIRARLVALSDDDVAGLLGADAEAPALPTTSALEYVRGLLSRDSSTMALREAPVPYAMAAPPPAPMSMPVASMAPAVMPQQAEESEGAADVATLRRSMPRLRDVPAAPPKASERPQNEPQSLERSQWERFSLGPNVELHVRRPSSRLEQRRVERLITIARQVLNEDQS